jgi:hypothetical protein
VGMKVPMAREENVSEKPMMGMQWVRKHHWSMRDLFYSSSTGTLTFVRTIETFVENHCHHTRTIHSSGSFLFFSWARL